MTITVIQPTRIHGAGPIPRYTCLGKQNPDCTATQHGTYSAYRMLGCRCPHAREAKRIYLKRLRENRSASRFTDGTGMRRRLRALSAIGWRWEDMAAHLGTSGQNVQNLARESVQPVLITTAARVRVLYDRLSTQPGPSTITRSRAIAKGWAPPHAWDEGAIDDPQAQPNLGDPAEQTDSYDPLTVALAIDGRLTHEQLATHRPDLIETVRRLAQRMSDGEIAHHLRWPGCDDGPPGKTRGQGAVCKLRNREGIPGPERYEAVYAYRPSGKRSRGRQSVQAAYMPNQAR